METQNFTGEGGGGGGGGGCFFLFFRDLFRGPGSMWTRGGARPPPGHEKVRKQELVQKSATKWTGVQRNNITTEKDEMRRTNRRYGDHHHPSAPAPPLPSVVCLKVHRNKLHCIFNYKCFFERKREDGE